MTNTRYYVNRILDYYEGTFSVEVVAGRDTGNPGRLGTEYRHLGEDESYADPRCAAIAAVRVQREWQKKREELIGLVHNGQVAGEWGVPGAEATVIELFMWANKEYRHLAKCGNCGDVLGATTYYIDWGNEERYCSDVCAEIAHNRDIQEMDDDQGI
jgi:hypothetical protein